MYKNVHHLKGFTSPIEETEKLKTNKPVETFLFDTFFTNGEFYALTKVTVFNGVIMNIEEVYPTMDHHEIINRERQILAEMDSEYTMFLTQDQCDLLDNADANSLAF